MWMFKTEIQNIPLLMVVEIYLKNSASLLMNNSVFILAQPIRSALVVPKASLCASHLLERVEE